MLQSSLRPQRASPSHCPRLVWLVSRSKQPDNGGKCSLLRHPVCWPELVRRPLRHNVSMVCIRALAVRGNTVRARVFFTSRGRPDPVGNPVFGNRRGCPIELSLYEPHAARSRDEAITRALSQSRDTSTGLIRDLSQQTQCPVARPTMETPIKELIAVGASVAANCTSCLAHHASRARESGAQQRDIATAIAVGRAVRKGAASKMDGFIDTVVSCPVAPANDAQARCGCR